MAIPLIACRRVAHQARLYANSKMKGLKYEELFLAQSTNVAPWHCDELLGIRHGGRCPLPTSRGSDT